MSEGAPEIWGWERFFEEVAIFLASLMRQYGTANESHSHYAVERLTICVLYVSNVRDHLQASSTTLRNEERDVSIRYTQELGEPISYLRQLRGHWEVYLDNMDQRYLSTAYCPSSPCTRKRSICHGK